MGAGAAGTGAAAGEAAMAVVQLAGGGGVPSPVWGLGGVVQMWGKVAATSALAHMAVKPDWGHSGMSGIAAN